MYPLLSQTRWVPDVWNSQREVKTVQDVKWEECLILKRLTANFTGGCSGKLILIHFFSSKLKPGAFFQQSYGMTTGHDVTEILRDDAIWKIWRWLESPKNTQQLRSPGSVRKHVTKSSVWTQFTAENYSDMDEKLKICEIIKNNQLLLPTWTWTALCYQVAEDTCNVTCNYM